MEGFLTTMFMMIYFPQTAVAGYIWAKSLKSRNLSVASTALEFTIIVLAFLVVMHVLLAWYIIFLIGLFATFVGIIKATDEMWNELE